MYKILYFPLIIPILFISLNISGCGDRQKKIDPKEHEEVINKLEEIRVVQSKTDKEMAELRADIEALEIEKQKLIAEKKRLEADIIDLKIKDRTTE